MVLIDDPRWPAHGKLWAHLVSDESLDELHAFAAENDLPPRGFDLDHYDVPEDRHGALIAAGAQHVSGHELVRRLIASGLRVTARERREIRTRAADAAGSTHISPADTPLAGR